MAYSPESNHFETPMASVPTDQIPLDGRCEGVSTSTTVDRATAPRTSRWRSNWVVANSHWPR